MAKFGNKFDSATVEWPTPQWLFDELNNEFSFTLDVAATDENRKCNQWFTKEDNGIIQKWSGVCWMNPPYGRKMIEFLKKAVYEQTKGVTTVALIPARTNTSWFHDLCLKYGEVRFVRGRPRFGDAKHGLPQPLVIVVFYANKHNDIINIGRSIESHLQEINNNQPKSAEFCAKAAGIKSLMFTNTIASSII